MLDTREMCCHQKVYNSNARVFFLSTVSNCEQCFLEIYLKLLKTKTMQIHNVKMFSNENWVRREGRLVKRRACHKIYLKCGRLRFMETNHIPTKYDRLRRKVIQSSFICFPRYDGRQSLKEYHQNIFRLKKVKVNVSKLVGIQNGS